MKKHKKIHKNDRKYCTDKKKVLNLHRNSPEGDTAKTASIAQSVRASDC